MPTFHGNAMRQSQTTSDNIEDHWIYLRLANLSWHGGPLDPIDRIGLVRNHRKLGSLLRKCAGCLAEGMLFSPRHFDFYEAQTLPKKTQSSRIVFTLRIIVCLASTKRRLRRLILCNRVINLMAACTTKRRNDCANPPTAINVSYLLELLYALA